MSVCGVHLYTGDARSEHVRLFDTRALATGVGGPGFEPLTKPMASVECQLGVNCIDANESVVAIASFSQPEIVLFSLVFL